MLSACIDIGSNTTRLLVAEVGNDGLSEVLSRRVFTRLGACGGSIPPVKLRETAAVVAEQAALARSSGARSVRVVATAAVRAAENGVALCAAIEAACGDRVEILTGEDEARLAFLGATATRVPVPEGAVAVVDVGGGSTELVCGAVPAGVSWSASLPVGSGTLTQRHVKGDPPSARELEAMGADIAAAFAPAHPPPAASAYAVGGSATSLHRLLGPRLDRAALEAGAARLCAEPVARAATRHGLEAERVRLLPAGMLLLAAAAARFGLPLRIAAGGLREGVLLDGAL